MNEANNNAPGDAQNNPEFGSAENLENNEQKQFSQNQDLSSESNACQALLLEHNSSTASESKDQKMDWQKVAHKLREYNRKLLKQVFRLEQDLAEVENKYNKQIDQARSSDVLVAQQAEEIKSYQEQIANFERKSDRKLAKLQEVANTQANTLNNLTQKYELAQQQTARIERDCVALQEDCNSKIYELTIKEREIKDLKAKLSQQQRYAIQHKAELERYKEATAKAAKAAEVAEVAEIAKAKAKAPQPESKRSIQPWSVTATSEPKISLPQTKIQPAAQSTAPVSKTVQTAAQIATWNAAESTTQRKKSSEKAKLGHKKPKSLAAVDLPTFPRPK